MPIKCEKISKKVLKSWIFVKKVNYWCFLVKNSAFFLILYKTIILRIYWTTITVFAKTPPLKGSYNPHFIHTFVVNPAMSAL